MLIYLAMLDDEKDKSKFEQLYLKYRQLMFYIANDILKDKHLAEDAVHKAFLKLINHLDKIQETEGHKTKSFIVIVTKNIAIDMYRKRKKENIISLDAFEYELEDLAATYDDLYEDNEVIAAITSLSHNYSSVLILKFSHGYSDAEIARILSITEENVRQRIARAKKKLKQILLERGL